MQGKAVGVEVVEGRPPKTIDVPVEKGGTYRYCLAQWTQEGMTAVYTFLYAVWSAFVRVPRMSSKGGNFARARPGRSTVTTEPADPTSLRSHPRLAGGGAPRTQAR
jgi:hypothetical protein